MGRSAMRCNIVPSEGGLATFAYWSERGIGFALQINERLCHVMYHVVGSLVTSHVD